MGNPLNGNLAAIVAPDADHIKNVRESATLCGRKTTAANKLKDFPLDAKRACAPCLVELLAEAIGRGASALEGKA
jgi:hypothetical protein